MRYEFSISQKGEYGKEVIRGTAYSFEDAVKFAEMALSMCKDIAIEISNVDIDKKEEVD